MFNPYNLRVLVGYRFHDRNDASCSVQESSLATEAAIWLGVDHAKPQTQLPTRMHLTQEQVRELLPMLTHFAEHGTLPTPEAPAHE